MEKNKLKKSNYKLYALLVFCAATLAISCTKYSGNTTTTTTSSGSSTTAPTPLPPLAGGGTSTGGSTGGTGTGTGTGTGGTANPNIPQAFIQGLFFAGLSNSYVTINDSIPLKQDGSYTAIYAGNTLLKYKVGSGASTDAVYTTAVYYTRPYSFYTYVLFKSPAAVAGETLLWNDNSAVAAGTAQVRFISLDPLTTAVPISFKLTNYLDNVLIPNRTYLDNRVDSNINSFKTITPGISNVSFVYRDSALLTFQQNFESGKKYTVFAGALSYVTSSKGTLPINYYQVARHN